MEPALREAFALTDRAVAWTFMASVLANLAGLPVTSSLADRAGRKRVCLACVAVFAAGVLAVALAPTFGGLLAGRVVQGVGASGTFPVAAAVIGGAYPPIGAGGPPASSGRCLASPSSSDPPRAGSCWGLTNWWWPFALSLPLIAVVFAWTARRLSESTAAARPFDAAGAATLVLLLAALVVGLSGLDASMFGASLARPAVWGPFGLAAALVAVESVERSGRPPPLEYVVCGVPLGLLGC